MTGTYSWAKNVLSVVAMVFLPEKLNLLKLLSLFDKNGSKNIKQTKCAILNIDFCFSLLCGTTRNSNLIPVIKTSINVAKGKMWNNQ